MTVFSRVNGQVHVTKAIALCTTERHSLLESRRHRRRLTLRVRRGFDLSAR